MKRRSSGEGSVYRIESGRDAGKWCAQVDLGWTPEGTRSRPRRIAATEREAKTALKGLLERRDAGVRQVTTVHEWLDYWLTQVVGAQRRPSTVAVYGAGVDWAKRGLSAHLTLLDLGPQHIRQLHATMRTAGASSTRVYDVTTILSRALNQAVTDQRILRNPATPILAAMRRPATTNRAALTWAQAVAAIDATTDPRARARLTVGFLAGLRPSEAIGLHWADIDLSDDAGSWRGVLHVRGQIGRHGADTGRYVLTKSVRSQRAVPLEPVAAAILADWRTVAPESAWVFPGTDPAKPIRYDPDRRRWADALAMAGAPPITPHGARATFTSRLLDRGVSVAVAARLLGDLPETLIKHYARSSEGIEREAMRELEG